MQEKKSEKVIDWDLACRRLQDETTRHGFTRQELAERAGVSARVVYKVMQGNARLRMDIVGKLANALGMDPMYVLHGERPRASDAVREPGVRYETHPTRLTGGWPEVLNQVVLDKREVIETGYNEYRLPIDEAIMPALREFETRLKGGV